MSATAGLSLTGRLNLAVSPEEAWAAVADAGRVELFSLPSLDPIGRLVPKGGVLTALCAADRESLVIGNSAGVVSTYDVGGLTYC